MSKPETKYWMNWYHNMDANDKKQYNHRRYAQEKQRKLQKELDALEAVDKYISETRELTV